MQGLNKALRESGELVSAEGLADPKQAKVVRAGKDGAPITDGVFPEAKEFLAGYWIVDVESPERAYEMAARASADERAARRILVSSLDAASEHLLRELAPQVLGAVIRRFRDFADAEDAVQ